MGVRNAVTTIKREVVLGYTRSVRLEDSVKFYKTPLS